MSEEVKPVWRVALQDAVRGYRYSKAHTFKMLPLSMSESICGLIYCRTSILEIPLATDKKCKHCLRIEKKRKG